MLDVLRFDPVADAAPRQRNWPAWALTYLYTFRAVVVGTCLILLAVAWLAHIEWLLMASMCIAVGEFLETTYYIIVLKWAEHTGRLRGSLLPAWGHVTPH